MSCTPNRMSRWFPSAVVAAAVAFSLLLVGPPVPAAHAQDSAPVFAVDVVNVRGEDESEKSRLDLYTKIPYNNLQFLQSDGSFEASYTVTADIYAVDEDGDHERLVTNRVWERSVAAESYEDTQSESAYDATTQSMALAPGNYVILFEVEDEASSRVFTRTVAADVRDLSGPVAVSDMILLSSYDESTNTISPLVTDRLRSDSKQLAVFYEMYVDGAETPLTITRRVERLTSTNSKPSVKRLLGLSNDESGSVYSLTEDRSFAPGRTQSVVNIPLSAFRVGRYAIHLIVKNAQGEMVDHATETFSLQWSGLTAHIQSLNDAVAQLQYIAKGDAMEHIRNAPNESERLRRFNEFWEKRDPTPTTSRNERMEEYYYRISYANRQYGTLEDGWRTDRGQVLVLFGQPDHVDRHPYNYSSEPYEIWYYYQMGKRFVFIDENGFGSFRLMIPIWDERNRIR